MNHTGNKYERKLAMEGGIHPSLHLHIDHLRSLPHNQPAQHSTYSNWSTVYLYKCVCLYLCVFV